MSAPTIPCPRCGIVLRPPGGLPQGTRVRCTACGKVFCMDAPSSDAIVLEEATPDLSSRTDRTRRRSFVDDGEPPRRSRSRRRIDDDDWVEEDERPRPYSGGPGAGMIAGLVAGGVLLVAGGAFGIWFWFSSPAPQPANQPPPQPPMVFHWGPGANPNQPVQPMPPVVAPQPNPGALVQNPAAKDDAPIPIRTLQALKAATVYVKVQVGAERASGSGFLVQTRGGEGFIVTNHHVVDPTDEPGDGPGINPFPFGGNFPGFPRGFPRFPGMPDIPQPPGFGPRFGPFNLPMLRPPMFRVRPNVSVVLHSGTAQQQSLSAEAVADDPNADLAVLRVRSSHDLPAPLNLQQKPDLAETLPIYILGFPFGAELAVGQGDPAITVCKGAVSALRHGQQGDLALVQITGEIHPGNSGGPVVDAQGRLVGIAVAKIKNTNIGFAIPAGQLSVVLSGRILSASVSRTKIDNGQETRQGHRATFDSGNRVQSTTQFSMTQPSHGGAGTGSGRLLVEVQLVDPLHQIRSVEVREAHGDVRHAGQPVQGGSWQPLPGEAEVPLKRTEQSAEVSLALHRLGADEDLYTFQFSYVTAGGRIVYTQPWVVRLQQVIRAPNAPKANQPLADADITSTLKDLQDRDIGKRWRALDRLARAVPTAEHRKAVASALTDSLADRNWATRMKAAKALGVWATKDDVPALLRLLKDDQFGVRHAALTALGRVKDPSTAEAVAARLDDWTDRGAADQALRAMGPAAETATRAHLKDADLTVRLAVCNILAEIGSRASLKALQDAAAHDDNPLVKNFAENAVNRISQRVR